MLEAIGRLGLDGGPLALLHGDTLVHGVDPGGRDMVSVAATTEAYSWAGCRIEEDRLVEVFPASVAGLALTPVLSGFFHFADAALFARGLAEHPRDFVAAVQHYLSRRPVRAGGRALARFRARSDLLRLADDAMRLYLPKTLARLEEYAARTGVDLDRAWRTNGVAVPFLREIAHRASARIGARHLGRGHGDFCFSNILYDFRSRSNRSTLARFAITT